MPDGKSRLLDRRVRWGLTTPDSPYVEDFEAYPVGAFVRQGPWILSRYDRYGLITTAASRSGSKSLTTNLGARMDYDIGLSSSNGIHTNLETIFYLKHGGTVADWFDILVSFRNPDQSTSPLEKTLEVWNNDEDEIQFNGLDGTLAIDAFTTDWFGIKFTYDYQTGAWTIQMDTGSGWVTKLSGTTTDYLPVYAHIYAEGTVYFDDISIYPLTYVNNDGSNYLKSAYAYEMGALHMKAYSGRYEYLRVIQNPTSAADVVNKSHLESLAFNSIIVVGRNGTFDEDYTCDGIADQVEINQAILACSSRGGGIVFLKRGNYAITASILLGSSDVYIVGEGAKTDLRATFGANVDSAIDITVSRTGIMRCGFDWTSAGINSGAIWYDLTGIQNIIIEDNVFNWADALAIGHTGKVWVANNSGFSIMHNTFLGSGSSIAIHADNSQIAGNIFKGIYATITIGDGTHQIRGIAVSHNLLERTGGGSAAINIGFAEAIAISANTGVSSINSLCYKMTKSVIAGNCWNGGTITLQAADGGSNYNEVIANTGVSVSDSGTGNDIAHNQA